MNDFLSQHARGVLGESRRCTATSKQTGERCGRPSSAGQFTCSLHGGKTPWGLKAGRERLMMLVEPALEVLYRATRSAPPCEVCGRSDADRDPTAVTAAKVILDRSGFGPQVKLEVSKPELDLSHLSTDEMIERLEKQLARAHARRDAERARLNAVDAETVDGDTVEI
jgi:hypothetical protein